MSMSHLIILGIIALVVIPPEKLPEMARQFARLLNELKRSTDQIMGELKQDALFKPEDIIDQNIKNKFSELQNQLNNNVSDINKSIHSVDSQITEMPPMPHNPDTHLNDENHLENTPAKIADNKKNE